MPHGCSRRALDALDPAVRAGLEESIARLRRTCEAELEPDVTTALGAGRPRHPPDGAGAPRRAVRTGRPGPTGLQRRDERRTGSGRGRLVHRTGQLAATGPRRSPRADDPRGLRAARGRRGVRRRRGAGDRDVRLRCGGVRAGRPGHRTRQHLHGRGQAAAQGSGRDRLPRPDRPRSRSWRTTAPTRRTSPPTWSARPSTTRGPPACWSPARRGWPTMSRRSSTSRSMPPGTPSASWPRSVGSSRASCWWTTSSRVSPSSTPTPPSTSRSTPPTRPKLRARVFNAGRRLPRAVRPGLAGRLLRRLQPRAADGRLRRSLVRAVRARVPQGSPRRRLLPGGVGRGRRPRRRACGGRGPPGPR